MIKEILKKLELSGEITNVDKEGFFYTKNHITSIELLGEVFQFVEKETSLLICHLEKEENDDLTIEKRIRLTKKINLIIDEIKKDEKYKLRIFFKKMNIKYKSFDFYIQDVENYYKRQKSDFFKKIQQNIAKEIKECEFGEEKEIKIVYRDELEKNIFNLLEKRKVIKKVDKKKYITINGFDLNNFNEKIKKHSVKIVSAEKKEFLKRKRRGDKGCIK